MHLLDLENKDDDHSIIAIRAVDRDVATMLKRTLSSLKMTGLRQGGGGKGVEQGLVESRLLLQTYMHQARASGGGIGASWRGGCTMRHLWHPGLQGQAKQDDHWFAPSAPQVDAVSGLFFGYLATGGAVAAADRAVLCFEHRPNTNITTVDVHNRCVKRGVPCTMHNDPDLLRLVSPTAGLSTRASLTGRMRIINQNHTGM